MTAPQGSAGGLEVAWRLSPDGGDQLRRARRTAKATNVVGMVDGHGMMYTTTGHNISASLALNAVARALETDGGLAHLTLPARTQGLQVLIPRQLVTLDGDGFHIDGGGEEGETILDLSGAGDGVYMAVIETWQSVVGPTTLGRHTVPAQFIGVVDEENKPGALALYGAGNIDSPVAISDADFVTATIQTQKMLQRQYRVRLMPERTLDGLVTDLVDASDRARGEGAYSASGDVAQVVVSPSLTADARAVDRTFTAAKLLLIERRGSVLTLHQTDPMALGAAPVMPFTGQRPLPVVRPRWLMGRLIKELADRLDATLASHDARLGELEAARRVLEAQAPSFALTNAPDQRVAFTQASAGAPAWHSAQAQPSLITPDFTGRVTIQVSVDFASGSGVRKVAVAVGGNGTHLAQSVLAHPSVDMQVTLAGELDVVAGVPLSVGVWSSEAAYVNAAVVSMRRVPVLAPEAVK